MREPGHSRMMGQNPRGIWPCRFCAVYEIQQAATRRNDKRESATRKFLSAKTFDSWEQHAASPGNSQQVT
jgi:hypothetical protein